MKLIYIAGPFRGKNSWEVWTNINSAAALALEVWRTGAVALCPHMNTFPFQGAAPDELWLRGNLEILSRCDAILLTPDWRRSEGATAEHDFATTHGITILKSIAELMAWKEKTA